jgi:hypothetical protein
LWRQIGVYLLIPALWGFVERDLTSTVAEKDAFGFTAFQPGTADLPLGIGGSKHRRAFETTLGFSL